MNGDTIAENIRALINQAQGRIQRLTASDRDRRALLFGGIGVLALIVYIIFQSFLSGGGTLEKRAQTLQEELAKVKSLRAEYIESKRKINTITASIKRESSDLLPLVEKILVDEQVERGNFSINLRAPTSGDLYEETSVDVDLRKIPLDKAVDVLYKIQTMPSFLRVSKLRLSTRFNDPSLMDVSFRVSTFKFKQEL
jgi:hypothetical protein